MGGRVGLSESARAASRLRELGAKSVTVTVHPSGRLESLAVDFEAAGPDDGEHGQACPPAIETEGSADPAGALTEDEILFHSSPFRPDGSMH